VRLITSLTVEQAGEERLLELARAHWGIENGGMGDWMAARLKTVAACVIP